MSEIAGRIKIIKERIAASAVRSGRKPGEICLVAVSKSYDASKIKEAIDAGITDIGENYLQEAHPKITEIGKAVRWHFIGHLQKNKVNAVLDKFDIIQSVDSLSLAEKIDKRAGFTGKKANLLLEVNAGVEETKSGAQPGEVLKILQASAGFKNIQWLGFMIIPPWSPDSGDSRKYFRNLKKIAGEAEKEGFPNFKNEYLSMGMTEDFEAAIEEGSTMVRIGRGIFGSRYKKAVAGYEYV
ncbi:MAG: YggS family pyridoxal phosphate-dependent enzyme [Firmicutes bacterium]|nr:YggS family pyridoxal phosphate-dependent enzyme [Bacillota bacterium]